MDSFWMNGQGMPQPNNWIGQPKPDPRQQRQGWGFPPQRMPGMPQHAMFNMMAHNKQGMMQNHPPPQHMQFHNNMHPQQAKDVFAMPQQYAEISRKMGEFPIIENGAPKKNRKPKSKKTAPTNSPFMFSGDQGGQVPGYNQFHQPQPIQNVKTNKIVRPGFNPNMNGPNHVGQRPRTNGDTTSELDMHGLSNMDLAHQALNNFDNDFSGCSLDSPVTSPLHSVTSPLPRNAQVNKNLPSSLPVPQPNLQQIVDKIPSDNASSMPLSKETDLAKQANDSNGTNDFTNQSNLGSTQNDSLIASPQTVPSNTEKVSKPRRKRRKCCGECGPCLIKENCGECYPCKNKGQVNMKCKMRKCVLLKKKNTDAIDSSPPAKQAKKRPAELSPDTLFNFLGPNIPPLDMGFEKEDLQSLGNLQFPGLPGIDDIIKAANGEFPLPPPPKEELSPTFNVNYKKTPATENNVPETFTQSPLVLPKENVDPQFPPSFNQATDNTPKVVTTPVSSCSVPNNVMSPITSFDPLPFPMVDDVVPEIPEINKKSRPLPGLKRFKAGTLTTSNFSNKHEFDEDSESSDEEEELDYSQNENKEDGVITSEGVDNNERNAEDCKTEDNCLEVKEDVKVQRSGNILETSNVSDTCDVLLKSVEKSSESCDKISEETGSGSLDLADSDAGVNKEITDCPQQVGECCRKEVSDSMLGNRDDEAPLTSESHTDILVNGVKIKKELMENENATTTLEEVEKISAELLERLRTNSREVPPMCNCIGENLKPDEDVEGPYYTHLGSAQSVAGIRLLLEKRTGMSGEAIRIEKAIFTGKEGKSSLGCPVAKWIIRRSGPEEKLLCIVRPRRGHFCESAVLIICMVAWEGVPQKSADHLYDYLISELPTKAFETERRCGTNEPKTCACQGWDETRRGASFSFGCSWSMYYNGCKYARSRIVRKFKLKDTSVEDQLEEKLQALATYIAPLYSRVAPDSYGNQVQFEKNGLECRLGNKPGRPFCGVTGCFDFCAHSHRDVHNMNNGCTVLVTLTKHRQFEKPDDEQLHVLPLYKIDPTDEYGSYEGQHKKIESGALEVLDNFNTKIRVRSTPLTPKKKKGKSPGKKGSPGRGKSPKASLNSPNMVKSPGGLSTDSDGTPIKRERMEDFMRMRLMSPHSPGARARLPFDNMMRPPGSGQPRMPADGFAHQLQMMANMRPPPAYPEMMANEMGEGPHAVNGVPNSKSIGAMSPVGQHPSQHHARMPFNGPSEAQHMFRLPPGERHSPSGLQQQSNRLPFGKQTERGLPPGQHHGRMHFTPPGYRQPFHQNVDGEHMHGKQSPGSQISDHPGRFPFHPSGPVDRHSPSGQQPERMPFNSADKNATMQQYMGRMPMPPSRQSPSLHHFASRQSPNMMHPGRTSFNPGQHQSHTGQQPGMPFNTGDLQSPSGQHPGRMLFNPAERQSPSGQHLGRMPFNPADRQSPSGHHPGRMPYNPAGRQSPSEQHPGRMPFNPADRQSPSGHPGRMSFNPADRQSPSGQHPGRMPFNPADRQSPSGHHPSKMPFNPTDRQSPSGQQPGSMPFNPSDLQSPSGHHPGRMPFNPVERQSPSGQNPGRMPFNPTDLQSPSGNHPGRMTFNPAERQSLSGQHPGRMPFNPADLQSPSGQNPGRMPFNAADRQSPSGQLSGRMPFNLADRQSPSGQHTGRMPLNPVDRQSPSGQHSDRMPFNPADGQSPSGQGGSRMPCSPVDKQSLGMPTGQIPLNATGEVLSIDQAGKESSVNFLPNKHSPAMQHPNCVGVPSKPVPPSNCNPTWPGAMSSLNPGDPLHQTGGPSNPPSCIPNEEETHQTPSDRRKPPPPYDNLEARAGLTISSNDPTDSRKDDKEGVPKTWKLPSRPEELDQLSKLEQFVNFSTSQELQPEFKRPLLPPPSVIKNEPLEGYVLESGASKPEDASGAIQNASIRNQTSTTNSLPQHYCKGETQDTMHSTMEKYQFINQPGGCNPNALESPDMHKLATSRSHVDKSGSGTSESNAVQSQCEQRPHDFLKPAVPARLNSNGLVPKSPMTAQSDILSPHHMSPQHPLDPSTLSPRTMHQNGMNHFFPPHFHGNSVTPRSDDIGKGDQHLSHDTQNKPSIGEQPPKEYEYDSNNEHLFQNPDIGGVAIAVGHGAVLFECAKRELHATTPLKKPNRFEPTRISLVFYQHKRMNYRYHGLFEHEKKMELLRQKRLRAQALGEEVEEKPWKKKKKKSNDSVGVLKKIPVLKYLWDAPTRREFSKTTDSVITRWMRPQPIITGPYQQWM